MDLMKHSEEIDPLSYLKVIDPYAVRQPWDIWNVWVIFKDVCEQNHARMLAVLRHTVGHAFKRSIVGGFKQAAEMKEK
jgi:hypothetical protein